MYILYIGHGAVEFVSPAPSGSVIANFEGTINDTTLICNVTHDEIQFDTLWSISNFRGVTAIQTLILLVSSQNLSWLKGCFSTN